MERKVDGAGRARYLKTGTSGELKVKVYAKRMRLAGVCGSLAVYDMRFEVTVEKSWRMRIAWRCC